jgi:glycosyltransferase involved in cell wall biosynthesis
MAPPLISVVLPTFNRSRVLACAIESVRRSTCQDWELLVTGDHCTDDTASVVAGFRDPRIDFVNLPSNAGEQSAPNNDALRRARGRYIAFLNHDDLYFPDHLATMAAFLQQSGADFAWSPMLVAIEPDEAEITAGTMRFRLSAVPTGPEYDPRLFVFASAWFMTRELAARVGEWLPARRTFETSSQNWLFRAWKSRARMKVSPHVTVLAIPAGARTDSYVRGSREHEIVASRMWSDSSFKAEAMASAALAGERELNRFRFGAAVRESLRAVLFRPLGAAAMACGVHPYAPVHALRYGGRGNVVNALRKRTGLKAIGR